MSDLIINPFVLEWTPTDPSNLEGWWDADDASTFSFESGVNVDEWRDKSGNGRHLANAGGYVTRDGAQNGRTTVVFPGIPVWMESGEFTVPQPLTIFLAYDRPNAAMAPFSSRGGDLQVA